MANVLIPGHHRAVGDGTTFHVRSGARQRVSSGRATIEIPVAADVLLIVDVPTNAVLLGDDALRIAFDSFGAITTTGDIGFVDSTTGADVGSGTSSQFFTAANVFSTAQADLGVETIGTPAGEVDIVGLPLWNLLGETSDPGGSYALAITWAAVTTGASGELVWRLEYAID